ncbi:NAD(P)-dependent oxidoreductase [Bacillus salacetis]|nr:NAD(P)-dependent oxidoreductase [Bacillus salacetis]
MSKTVITGGLGFLGFELCLAFLEEGFEVLAVDIEDKAGRRWLEVGRNANITYQPLQQALLNGCSAERAYINLYDHFTVNKSDGHLGEIKKFLENNHSTIAEAIVLLPSVIPDGTRENELMELLAYTEDQFEKHYKIYIPTLFGPHQPGAFLFQQILDESEQSVNYVDDIRDAIFVKDAASAILTIKNISQSKNIQLTTGSSDSWSEILGLLGRPEIKEPGRLNDIIPDNVEKLKVHSSSLFKDVLDKQRNC